jgi:hypothetical protein
MNNIHSSHDYYLPRWLEEKIVALPWTMVTGG